MNEDLRHTPENIKRLSDQKEFGSGDVFEEKRVREKVDAKTKKKTGETEHKNKNCNQ